MSCATPLTTEAPSASATTPAPIPMPPPPPVRHRQPHEDILGLLSLAFFLFAVAVMFAQNPNLLTDLRTWSDLVARHNTIFVRPPEAIIVSAAWFFGTMGVLEFVSAGLRWALGWMPLRAAARALSGVGDLMFSVLLLLYSARTLTGTFLLTYLVGAVGVLLLIYVTLGIYWASTRVTPRPEAVQPPARQ